METQKQKKFERYFYKNEHDRRNGIVNVKTILEKTHPYLLKDIHAGIVFPALRKNEIDFYYCGNKLYQFRGGNTCGSWFSNNKAPSSVSEYEAIKKEIDAKVDTGIKSKTEEGERAVLSAFVSLFSPYMNKFENDTNDICLLDMEIGFPELYTESNIKEYSNIQIDLLFLNLQTGKLTFVEAKAIGDDRLTCQNRVEDSPEDIYARLCAESTKKEKVGIQIKKYFANLTRWKGIIEEEYATHYLSFMNDVFGVKLSPQKPVWLDTTPILLIYGMKEHTPGMNKAQKESINKCKRSIQALEKHSGAKIVELPSLASKEELSKLPKEELSKLTQLL